jgi:DNA-binding transcriptional ArsR family regulator
MRAPLLQLTLARKLLTIHRRCLFTAEPVCVRKLTPTLRLAQPTVSHPLKKLTEAGLLEREERGKLTFYSLSGEALEHLASLVEFKEVAA